MATQKKSNTKSGNKKNGKTNYNKNTKKSAPGNGRQLRLEDCEPSHKGVIAVICFCAFAVFMGAVVLIDAGGVWGYLRNFFFGVFGVSAFIIPFFIIFLSAVCALKKNTKAFNRAVIFAVAVYTLLMGFIHIVQTNAEFSYGEGIAVAYNTFKSFGVERGIHYGVGVYGALFGGIALLITGGSKVAAGFINVFLIVVTVIVYLAVFKGLKLSGVLAFFKKIGEQNDEENFDDEVYEEEPPETEKKKRKNKNSDNTVKETQPESQPEKKKKRIKNDDEFAFDVPLPTHESRPDMGIDDIFKNGASILDEETTGVSMKNAPPKKLSAEEEFVNIDLLDSFENSPVKKAPPLEELFGVSGKSRADEGLEQCIDELNTETENAENSVYGEYGEPTEETVTPSDVELARSEIENEIIENELPQKIYELPPLDCLDEPKSNGGNGNEKELRERAEKIVSTLKSFGVGTHIVDICRSPSVTRFELQPDPGVKISRITALSDDIAMNLAASGVRIEAPIPNKNAVGIEVPNSEKTTVTLREIIDTPLFKNSKSKLNVALGRNIQGEPTCCDIAKMPHLLVAGTTGSGKSVCLNSMIVSILYNATPDEVKLVMIDPKKVEFTVYRSIPHLLVPVVSDPRKAAGALSWAVAEMDKRYQSFAENGVRNLQGYNAFAVAEGLPKMPQIVIIIDELADLMMAASNEVEDLICRLAQKARAAGMHLIVATQRPSVDVITGLIKANIPSRIAFAVKSQVDSRTIIDTQGAEKLLGYGDMLFCPVGLSKPLRVQGAYLSDEEIERVVEFVKTQGEVSYDESVIREIEEKAVKEDAKKKGAAVTAEVGTDEGDEMVPKAIEVVVEAGAASTTLLQRKLKLGYARAARVMDELEEKGIIGPYEGAKPRKVLITRDQWYEMQANSATTLKPSEQKSQLSLFDEPAQKPVQPQEEHNYFGSAVNNADYDESEDF